MKQNIIIILLILNLSCFASIITNQHATLNLQQENNKSYKSITGVIKDKNFELHSYYIILKTNSGDITLSVNKNYYDSLNKGLRITVKYDDSLKVKDIIL